MCRFGILIFLDLMKAHLKHLPGDWKESYATKSVSCLFRRHWFSS